MYQYVPVAASLPVLVAASGVCLWWLCYRPAHRVLSSKPVLILAAHPDDCVIMAGETALAALAEGHTVRVVYLTAGCTKPGSETSRRRREETVAAWDSVGVPESSLTFLDLPETPIGLNSAQTVAELRDAEAEIADVLRSIPHNSRVVIPADGELHADHATIRRLSLSALRAVDRPDLEILEAPEYNAAVSLTRTPKRAFLQLVMSIPFAARVLAIQAVHTRANFVSGPRGFELAPVRDRLEAKRALLRAFTSQNPALLERAFGFPDLLRTVSLESARTLLSHPWYTTIGFRRVGASLLLLWLSVFAAASAALLSLGLSAARHWGGGPEIVIAGFAISLVMLGVAWWQRAKLERRLAMIAGALGLDTGVILGSEAIFSLLVGG